MRWLPVLMLLAACPERAQPERGIALTYKKPEDGPDLRATVDRRLAHLKLKAHLSEDMHRLTVRVTNGAELEHIKALMAVRGELRFCEEDADVARAVCAIDAPNVEVERGRDGKSCTASATRREDLVAAVGDAGVTLLFEKNDARLTGFPLKRSTCVTPRVVGVEPREEPMPSLMLDFDKSSAAEFNELTARCVGRHLLIVLDDELQSAPVVLEPITGRSAMLAVDRMPAEKRRVLEAALAGGALPPLELEKEARYGPPTLTGR
jgi:hypothetical protein